MRDSRLEGSSFSDLVEILCAALDDPDQTRNFAIKLNLMQEIPLSGDADTRWTSLLNVVAVRSEKVDELEGLLEKKLRGTVHYGRFQAWCGRGEPDRLSQSIAEFRQFRKALLDQSDPRKAQAPLGAMRSSVTDIKEIVADRVASDSILLAADADDIVAARNEVLAACRKTLAALDQLMVGISDAKRQSTRVRHADGGQEAFIANRIIMRHLLDDRSTVDVDSQELLDAIDERVRLRPVPAPRVAQPGPVPESADA